LLEGAGDFADFVDAKPSIAVSCANELQVVDEDDAQSDIAAAHPVPLGAHASGYFGN
jgi:hypothetical protein